MKRFTTLIVIFVLMLCSAQSVFAKNYVNLNVDYAFLNMTGEAVDLLDSMLPQDSINLVTGVSGLHFSIGAGYDLTSKISIAGDVSAYVSLKDRTIVASGGANANSIELVDLMAEGDPEPSDINYFSAVKVILDVNAYARYDAFNLNNGIAGLQAGMTMDSSHVGVKIFDEGANQLVNGIGDGIRLNAMFFTLGTYFDVDVAPKWNVYGDVNIALATKFWVRVPESITKVMGLSLHTKPAFTNAFYMNASVGAGYEVSPNVYLGAEVRASNMSVFGLLQSVINWLDDLNIATGGNQGSGGNEDEGGNEGSGGHDANRVNAGVAPYATVGDDELPIPASAGLWKFSVGISLKYVF